jgi:hypothetical protein
MTTVESRTKPTSVSPGATPAPAPERRVSTMHLPETAARIAEMMKTLGPSAVEALRKHTTE